MFVALLLVEWVGDCGGADAGKSVSSSDEDTTVTVGAATVGVEMVVGMMVQWAQCQLWRMKGRSVVTALVVRYYVWWSQVYAEPCQLLVSCVQLSLIYCFCIYYYSDIDMWPTEITMLPRTPDSYSANDSFDVGYVSGLWDNKTSDTNTVTGLSTSLACSN